RLPLPREPERSNGRPTTAPLFWWPVGRDGWPRLVIPGGSTYAVEASSGRVAYSIDEMPTWMTPADLDGDGLPEMIATRQVKGRRGQQATRLFAFQGQLPVAYRILGGAGVAGDLDGDGVPELLGGQSVRRILSGADGRPLWTNRDAGLQIHGAALRL